MNYDWLDYKDNDWEDRFPRDAQGFREWSSHANEKEWLPTLGMPPSGCPRVFISHRQADRNEALRIAYLANKNGFEYWLDILDMPPKPGQTNTASAFATAQIIEMALLNCTHVAAILTVRTAGSQWVPYEYGRVKDRRVMTEVASAWVQPSIRDDELPEYLFLGRIHRTETEIEDWLRLEKMKKKGVCIPHPFHRSVPEPLPRR